MKVVFCCPFLDEPTPHLVSALEASIPLIKARGWEEGLAQERGCPYISWARASLLRKALDAGADVIVYLDYDLSWRPADLVTLIETPGDVVAGLYRFKRDDEEYMGTIRTDDAHRPIVRDDGCIEAIWVPAGFLKVTKEAVARLMGAYPELLYGPERDHFDMFNHGAHNGLWWGEDYAFSRRWTELGESIWVVPDLNLTHHGAKPYPGNFHEFMLKQPGGRHADSP